MLLRILQEGRRRQLSYARGVPSCVVSLEPREAACERRLPSLFMVVLAGAMARFEEVAKLAPAEAGRARTTIANPLPYFCNDKAPTSLSLLLTRFLTTAFPTLLETMNPIRLGSSAARAAVYNTTFRRPLRTPERTVVEKSVDVRRRFLVASTVQLAQGYGPTSQLFRPTVRCGPCHDGLPGWHGRHGYAYEGGSRASWLDGGYSAEKSACSR